MDYKNIKYGDNDVALIGIGLRLPGNCNRPSELWENLLAGFDGIVETTDRWSDTFSAMEEISSRYAGLVDLDEWMSFDPLFFGINPTDAKQIDPQQKLLLKCTWEAFEDANIDPLKLRGSNTSVYMGASSIDYATINMDIDQVPINIFNTNMSGVSNRISYCYDFRGTSLTIDTACSSSLNAVHLGYKSIVNGECDYSIVGGCNFIMSPHTSRSFDSINVTSKTGKSKTFDKDADGFVRSEGVVSIILKKMSKAIEDGDQIYSVIKGSSSNVDGNLNKGNFFAPSKQSQANNIINAFESCNKITTNSTPIAFGDIDFFELHGTSTQVGDPIECEGVSSVFKSTRKTPLLIGSIKSNIGHLEPASGVASLVKVALMFKHRQFVKNINFDKPNPNIKFNEWNIKVCTKNTAFPNNKKVSMAINSFGITGSNACLILTEYVRQPTSNFGMITPPSSTTTNTQKYLIPISANSKSSLETYKEKLINSSIEFSQTIKFKDFVKYQLNSKTLKLAQRSVIIASNWDEVASHQSVLSTNTNRSGNINKEKNNPQLVFVFSGQGPQYSKMFVQLYDSEPIFKESVDKVDLILSKYYGYSILKKINSIKEDDTILINEPILAQPSIFMIQIALIELYKHWGVVPSISVGHSLGEISSAFCSGMIDLETACLIIYHRSILQQKTIGSGRMLVIGINEQQFNQDFSNKYPLIEISCYNSPSSIVISGSESELIEISNKLKENELFSLFLGTQSSFHSSKQEILKDEILNKLKDIKSSSSKIPNFSTVTSNLFNSMDDSQQSPDESNNSTTLFNSNYIFENIRKPVLFENTIKNIFNFIEKKDLGSVVIFLEISPSPVLGNYIKEMIPQDSNYFYIEDQTISILSSMNKKSNSSVGKDQLTEIQTSLSQLYCRGYNVNFNCTSQTSSLELQDKSYKYLSDVLFKYSWDEDIYFSQSPIITNYKKNGPTINQLGYQDESNPIQSYISTIDISKEPYEFLKGHSSTFKNKILYPGCGYIDSVLKSFSDQDLTIQSMEFKSPILLQPSVKTILATNIIPSGKNEYRILFHYKDKLSNKWILSCSGRISTIKHNVDQSLKKMNITKLKEKCNFVTIQKKELYEAIKYKAQLAFEGKFASIQEASYGLNCCLSKVPLTTLSSYDNESFLNLCVIDSGFQPLSVIKENQQPMVFSSIENLQFFSKNIPKSAADREVHKFIYTFTQVKETKSGSFYCSIVTMLQDGTVLFFSPSVIYTQLTPYKNQFTIESPNDNLFKICYQSKDSPLPSPLVLKDSFDKVIFSSTLKQTQLMRKALTNCLFSIFKKNNNSITKAEIKSQSIDYLIETYCLIVDNDDDNDGIDDNSILVNGGVTSIDDLVLASTTGKEIEIENNGKRSLAKLIFQILKTNIELFDYANLATYQKTISKNHNYFINGIGNLIVTPLSVTNQISESNLINETHSEIENIKMNLRQYDLIVNSISTTLLLPIINQNVLFRILEINSGFGYLSEMLINKINQLISIEFESSNQIEIEFTFTLNGKNQDENETISNLIKDKLLNLLKDSKSSSITIIFKPLNLNESFLEQSFNPSYYDLIIVTNLSNISNLNQSIEFINQILYSNGHLIIIDTKFQSIFQQYEIYDQFLIYSNFGNSSDFENDWNKLLIENKIGFNNLVMTENIQPRVIQVQKLKLIDKPMTSLEDLTGPYDQIIVIGDQLENADEQSFQVMDINKQGTDIYRIKTIEEFDQHVLTVPVTEKSFLVFISSMNELSLGNYKQINFDYIRVVQYLLKNKLSCPFILATRMAAKESTNSLASALIGTFRYFSEFSNILNLYSFDFGEKVFEYPSPYQWLNMAIDLVDSKKHIQREYIFRNNETWFERIGKIKRVKSSYPSTTSFIDDKPDLLVARLNQNLKYQLEAKQSNLLENEIEVQVVATGINFKDSLIYRNLVSPLLINHEGDFSKPELGFECSGIVSRIGSKVVNFKVGDSVLGYSWKSTSSHVVNIQDAFVLKPDNLSFVEAASIPLVYCTAYYSLFHTGNLDINSNESVLIHQASGGVGLACLNILKSKGFKSKLFVTVGSKEKEDFLRQQYGDFITGIYSSRNTDFLQNIKSDLSPSKDQDDEIFSFIHNIGIDLIINTLPFEFLDSNFNLLSQGGRIVDLSVNHLNTNDTTDFNKFKWFKGYSTVEIFYNGFEKAKHTLSLVTDMIKSKQLSLIPIKEFPINQIKDAIEFIGQRIHIGKIVVNHQVGLKDGCLNLVQDTIKSFEQELKYNYLIASPEYKFMGDYLGKTILFTGQSGISLSIIQTCLFKRHQDLDGIIVCSKSAIKHDLKYLISLAKSQGVKTKIYFKQVDCSNMEAMRLAITDIYKKDTKLPLVESIFHNAFVPVTSEPLEIDMKHIDDAYDAKTTGAMNLFLLSISFGWKLKNFLFQSSISSIVGSSRQAGYCGANAVLDSLAKVICAQGIRCTSISWGCIADIGYLSRNDAVAKFYQTQGQLAISSSIVLGSLDLLLQQPNLPTDTTTIVASFDFNNLSKPTQSNLSYKFDYFTNPVQFKNNCSNDTSELSIRQEILMKFAEFLSIDDQSKIGLDIKLIDYGAESMILVEIKNFLDKTYTPNILSIQQLSNVTINQLIQAVTEAMNKLNGNDPKKSIKTCNKIKQQEQQQIDWVKEIKLNASIKPTDQMIKAFKEQTSNNVIFLTGASGFVGIYLLYSLIKSSTCSMVYCLIRRKTIDEATTFLIEFLKVHQLYDQLTADEIKKIQPVLGDYTLESFGLSTDQYTKLSNSVNLIINSAASVNHQMDYHASKVESVEGVLQCIKFSCNLKLKKLLQVSTLGIYSDDKRDNLDDYTLAQIDPNIIQSRNSIMTGYLQGKIVSEYHIKEAALRKIPCSIIRLPFILPSPITGIGRDLDLLQTIMQSCFAMSTYPKQEAGIQFYAAPVTWVANNLSFISMNSKCWPAINKNNNPISENLTCFNLFGESICFNVLLTQLADSLKWKPATPNEFIKKLKLFDNEPSCKKLLVVLQNSKNLLLSVYIPGNYKLNPTLKQILQSNNSYEGWKITPEIITKHLSFVFKKEIK